jgi:EAL domain-containing protein (putative c-di-GMP-specific phosphodiesterase class I)
MVTGQKRKDGLRRLRYVAVAMVAALLVSIPNLLQPFDIVQWTLQAKLGHNAPSGEIVFVEVPDDVLEDPAKRDRLRRSLASLEKAGAQSIFLDLARPYKDDSGPYELDWGASSSKTPIISVGRLFVDRNTSKIVFPDEGAESPLQRVVATHKSDFMGFVWRVPARAELEGKEYTSFASRLAGNDGDRQAVEDGWIEVDYRFDAADIPVLRTQGLDEALTREGYAVGKSFVFGYAPYSTGDTIRLPGSNASPSSYVDIFAAETIRKGGVFLVGPSFESYLPLLVLSGFLLSIVAFFGRTLRTAGYILVIACYLAAIMGPVMLPFRTGIGSGVFFLCVYAMQCVIYRWRSTLALQSEDTGLPTLLRLEQDIAALPVGVRKVLIVAKLHNFSEVMATIPASAKKDYFSAIVKRLRVADTSLVIYSNGADHLFWLQDFESQETTKAHLMALLAIFKNPLRLNDKAIDVSMTCAVDFSFAGEGHRRISLAEALTDKTSLSAKPILFGDEPDGIDEEWRVSLQSKIDAALSAGEIFPVFQPQVDLQTGAIVGFEGLLRWKDRERGLISPSYFVEQCEQVGRMEKLQEFMLRECVRRFQASSAMRIDAWLSINVSATLLSDTWLPELVVQVLDETGFPSNRLVLEITETARIQDHDTASAILAALSKMGVELSLDDFGTGTAGLENFYRLPFSELKIDRLFINVLSKSDKAQVIVQSAITIGNSLGIRVIAEGIEDQETREILARMGCRIGQGYLFSKPLENIDGIAGLERDRLRSG